MRQTIIAGALAVALLAGWSMPSAAQQNAAPAEEYSAPAEGDYQAYSDEEYVEPVPDVAESVVEPLAQHVLKLPSTGAGPMSSMSLATAAGMAALALGAMSLRRRLLT